MKILYISILYAPNLVGGVEHTLKALAEGMAAKGHQVTVLTTGAERGLHREEANGVRIIRTKVHNLYWHAIREKPPAWQRPLWHLLDSYNYPMRRVVADVLAEIRPDVVSAHNLAGFSVSVWDAAHRAGIPLVQVLHDQYLLCPNSTMFRNGRRCKERCKRCLILRALHPRLSAKVPAVIGVSRFILDHHLRFGYFPETAVRAVIHDARSPLPGTSPKPRQDEGVVRFGYIGALAPGKGIELLLRTFQEEKNQAWRLDVAGVGDQQYEKSLRERYAGDNIVFHGSVRPEEFYPSLDVLVVPSLCDEALGGVVFEGMSYGLPVVGAERGGIPEMIRPGENGLLFDPDQHGALAAALREIGRDPGFRAATGQAARESSRHFTDLDRFLNGHEAVYQQLCASLPDRQRT